MKSGKCVKILSKSEDGSWQPNRNVLDQLFLSKEIEDKKVKISHLF